jgi:predicted ATPase
MLTRLRIKNFKSLADTGDMDIRPLTFLVGPNSAGKSSVLQVLLMLRQTGGERDPSITLKFNGSWVKLGSYPECVHRVAGEESEIHQLEISFTFLLLARFGFVLSGFDKTVDFSSRFGYDGEVFLQRASYEGGRNEFIIERIGERQYKTNQDIDVQPQKFYAATPISEKFGSVLLRSNLEYARALEFFLSQVFYLGPLRQRPELYYEESGGMPQDVGLFGERTIDVLIASDKKQKDAPLAQLRHWLNVFDIASDVELIAHTPTLYEFQLTDKQTGVLVNYAHVGFGASQILPIIVEGFYSPEHALLLVEQPEIHLHPRAQARLGDLLVDISQASKTLIVETHSEHLLSQVQVRIAQGDVKREDVAIYYFEPTSSGTRVVPIEINALGQFVNWPPGFFDQGLKLADAHLQAITAAQGRGHGRD